MPYGELFSDIIDITVILFRSGHNPPDPCNLINRPVTIVTINTLLEQNNLHILCFVGK